VTNGDGTADTVWRDGAVTALPAPAVGVPRDLLRGLKRLFDPAGTQPTPAWLAANGEGSRGGS
jgi:hypothetical protein